VGNITISQTEILGELRNIRSALCFTPATILESGRFDMGGSNLEVPTNNTFGFLQHIAESGGIPSEQEIWEMIWDFVQADEACDGLWTMKSTLRSFSMNNGHSFGLKVDTMYRRQSAQAMDL